MLAEGSLAPDFDVAAHDGSRVRLSDYTGKYVVLWFYPEADTPGCTIEGNTFRERIGDFEKRGVIVLGASFDEPAKNCAFADKFSFSYKLLSFDKAIDLYDANDPTDPGWPRRISYLIGPDRRIVKTYDKVDPATHPGQVLADLAVL